MHVLGSIGDYHMVIANINTGLLEAGIERSELSQIDHICYRVETDEQYEIMKQKIGNVATSLGASEIGGREITIFELDEYLESGGWTIPYIELPAPKPGSFYKQGFEHAEIVVIGGLERFISRHPDLPFAAHAMEKVLNPELKLKAFGMSVKFHESAVGAIARIEQRLRTSA